MQAVFTTAKALLSPAGGDAMQRALCAAMHIRFAAQPWPYLASVAQPAIHTGLGACIHEAILTHSTAATAYQAPNPQSQQLQHGAPNVMPSWQHTCNQLPQPSQIYSVLHPQPTCMSSIRLQQHRNNQLSYRHSISTSSRLHSADEAAGRSVSTTESADRSTVAAASASAARGSAERSQRAGGAAVHEALYIGDEDLDPDEGEVLLDEWEEPDVRLDGSSSMLDAEWTSEGAVSTSSPVDEFEDSADEYDVEFDEDFDFEDEEGLQDNLPDSSNGKTPGV